MGCNSQLADISASEISVLGVQFVGGVAGRTTTVGGIAPRHTANFASGKVEGSSRVGGLVGINNVAGALLSVIKRNRFIGEVKGLQIIGGIVGEGYSSRIENSYARARLISNPAASNASTAGGLAGTYLNPLPRCAPA